jgi:hypothetical protein
MKRVILGVLTVVLAASMIFAQGAQSSLAASSSVAGDFTPLTFRGCLSQTGTQYELTVGGAMPRQYHLLGSNLAQLDGKAGHMVSITGTVPDSLLVGDSNGNTTNNTINFLSVDDLASSCKAQGDSGPESETPYSTIGATTAMQVQSLMPFDGFTLSDPRSQPGSYMVVPLVGGFTLALLHAARYYRRK